MIFSCNPFFSNIAANPFLHDRQPKSILSCIDADTGNLDPQRLGSYLGFRAVEAQHNLSVAIRQAYYSSEDYYNSDDEVDPLEPPVVKKRRRMKCVMARRLENGEMERILPTESFWYSYYVTNPQLDDSRFLSKFRNRFRLPYTQYRDLVADCKGNDLFQRWTKCDAIGTESTPIELLVLGSLRYLGRGWTFDDIEESTAVSREVHRVFFHQFIEFGSTTLYNRYVVFPSNFDEAKRHMHEFTLAGLPGAVGSTDATHITSWCCQYNLRNNHIGGKSKSTTRTFNMTVNHRRRILHSTRGGPGRWNDKTMVLFDRFVKGIYDGDYLHDVEFTLLEKRNGRVVPVKYCGGYVIVDNGYLNWSISVPPFKVSNLQSEIRWSKWLESMRKDVECAFGILKGRWRILKTGIRLQGVEVVDKVWLTCCALHNWLLDIDGLDAEWEGRTVPAMSEWEGELGEVDMHDLPHNVVQVATSATFGPRNYDSSGMGPGDDVLNELHEFSGDVSSDFLSEDSAVVIREGEVRKVGEIGLGYFRRRLVEHFDILFKKNQIKWTERRGHRPSLS